jgi:hypothetical protein
MCMTRNKKRKNAYQYDSRIFSFVRPRTGWDKIGLKGSDCDHGDVDRAGQRVYPRMRRSMPPGTAKNHPLSLRTLKIHQFYELSTCQPRNPNQAQIMKILNLDIFLCRTVSRNSENLITQLTTVNRYEKRRMWPNANSCKLLQNLNQHFRRTFLVYYFRSIFELKSGAKVGILRKKTYKSCQDFDTLKNEY